MDVLRIWWLLSCVAGLAAVIEDNTFCNHETFQPRCLSNQVVLISGAKYGRMEVGRCIKTDFGYIGCSLDVLDQLNARCSGRRGCEIRIPDADLDKSLPCHEDLKYYLEADYSCVNVSTPEADTCPPNTTNNITNTSGYFASIVTKETGCGNESSPWKILAAPGQRINITLVDFGRKGLYEPKVVNSEKQVESAAQILCKELAVVEEDDMRTVLSSCEGSGGLDPGGKRFTSMGHNITVYIRGRTLDEDTHFVIKYEVDGCPDIEPTKLTWVTRDADKVAVGCIGSPLAWHMTCLGNTWHGEPGNCSAGEIRNPRKEGDGTNLTIGTSIIIILVVSGFVGITVLAVGLYCMRRYRARRAMHDTCMNMKDVRPLNQDEHYDDSTLYARNNAFTSAGRPRIGKQKLTGKKKKNKDDHDYEYVWDMSGSKQPPMAPDSTLQTCVVTGGTPKSPRAAHTPPDMCVCPEIHVHVHHSTESRLEGGQAQVSRVHIQARTDHSTTMPRMSSRTPNTSRRGETGTLRAIQAPPTPQRNRKAEPGHMTVGRHKTKDRHDHGSHHGNNKQEKEKRYWTLPVKSAFKTSSKSARTPDSTG